MTPLFRAFGLRISSDLDLPELASNDDGGSPADVSVRFGEAAPPPGAVKNEDGHEVAPRAARLAFPDVGAFLVSDGREVIVDPEAGVDERTVRLSLLGPVFAVLLHQRGFLVLHASAVAIGERAVAFLGESEWGKSTTAAAFFVAGRPFVADDVAAVSFEGDRAFVTPAFPQSRLWPESVTALGLDPSSLPLVHPAMEKRSLRTDARFRDEPLPLERIYLLAPGEELRVEPVDGHDAFVELVRHSYAASILRESGAQAQHFVQCTKLARIIGFRRLVTPNSLAGVGDIVTEVERDLASAG